MTHNALRVFQHGGAHRQNMGEWRKISVYFTITLDISFFFLVWLTNLKAHVTFNLFKYSDDGLKIDLLLTGGEPILIYHSSLVNAM